MLLVLAIMLGLAGCATTAKRAVEGGVEGSLEGLAEPESKRNAEELATSEEMQNATEAISASVTRGILAGLTEGDNADKLREAPGSYLDDAGPRIERIMRDDIAPGVAAIIRQSVEATLSGNPHQQQERNSAHDVRGEHEGNA